MKKLLATLLCLVCLLCLSTTALASNDLPSIIDEAGLLTQTQALSLETQEKSLRKTHGFNFDIVILTVESTQGRSPRQYAESYYDRQGYADDGILLLISMEERDWYICTTGKCQDIFTSYGIDQLGDRIVPYLSEGEYYHAFRTFIEQIPHYCEAYAQGKPIDRTIGVSHVLIALCIGAAIGGITIAIMRSAMNTAKPKPSATEYVKQGSFRPYGNFDMYLYSRITKRRRQSSSSGSHGGGGGGSRSHSGGGGKF